MLLLATSVSYSLLLFSSICPQPASTSRLHNNYTDLESLLAFKSQVSDPFRILFTNWTTNAPFCEWVGVSCSNPRHQRVTVLDLRSTALQGTISPHLGNLSFLSYLDLANCSLTGHIPNTLGGLPRLSYLTLDNNTLSGPIPNSIFNMSTLTVFAVPKNNLSGPLSSNDNIIMLPRLQFISVSVNQLTGEFPSSFVECKDLQVFSLSSNKFTGNIPVELGYLPRLTKLAIGGNRLNGPIPSSLGNLTNLNLLDLSWNNLTGTIPDELGSLVNLQLMFLGCNDLLGSIPISLLNTSKLNHFDLISNKLTGPVPATIGESMPLLSKFDLGENHLIGGLDFITSLSNCKALQILSFHNNKFEGVLPDSIGNLSNQLQFIYGYENHIRGNIPAAIGNLSGLTGLSLFGNELIGPIPLELSKLKGIQAMDLHSNHLNGPIPHELGQLKSMYLLGIYYNRLSRSIPDSLGNLTELQHLGLNGNSLSSIIPQSLWNLKGLIELDISYNLLSGTLPLEMSNLKALNSLYLQNNQLSGNVSDALGAVQMLSYLDLSNNSFSGQIPQSLGNIIGIKYMNLSHNALLGNALNFSIFYGAIPESLASLRHLDILDLSFNNLEGKIPEGRVFSNFTIPLLQGNKGLCGALQLGFPPCSENMRTSTSTDKMHLIIYIALPIATALVLIACLYFLSKLLWSRKSKAQSPNDIGGLNSYRSISYHELVRATENFSEKNFLGRGSCSSVFRACLDDGMITAVKVINLTSEGTSKSFEVECRALSTVRHRNLVRIISICSSLDFKSIVVQFMQNGSLEKWLHSDDLYINLLQRLEIMVDVALALEYLHHHHPHVVIHCDLKPSNVLLDENMVARVGDFGIAKLFYGDSIIALSTNARGTIGYMAPEYGFVGKVSRKSDVYSFGILLLETFTRKKPTNSMFNEELSLRQWVHKAYPVRIMEIVDNRIVGDDCVYERTPQVITSIHQCLSSIIEVGLLCSVESPKERLSMKDVVPRLQKIKVKYLRNQLLLEPF